MKRILISLLCVFPLISAAANGSALKIENLDAVAESKQSHDVLDLREVFFGTVDTYETRYRNIRLTNTGTRDIENLVLEIEGHSFRGYTNCERELLVGERCTVQIAFRPYSSGRHSGYFYIDADGEMQDIYLWGYGEHN